MSIDRLIELLSHSDPDWRRQGRELMRALGDEASAEILRRVTRHGWLWPLGDGDASELVVALAESAGIDEQRARVRELPPIATCDARDIATIVSAFPNATLRLLWEQSPESVEFLAELPCTKLQLSVGRWTAEPPVFSKSLTRLAFFGGIPEIEAPGLRELEVASWSSSWFETTFDSLAPQLEVLRVLNRSGELPRHFPRLRELRVPELSDRLSVDAPLESLHVEHTSGRVLMTHPAVGPRTRIRADDWPEPDPVLVGDPRLVWIGARRAGWESMLESLPNLEVAEVEDLAFLPLDVLPTPWMLSTVEMSASRRSSALAGWARRARPWVLRSRTRTRQKIMGIKRVRTFSAWGLAFAKRFFEAIDGDGLFALNAHEALYWQAVLRDLGMGLEVSSSSRDADR